MATRYAITHINKDGDRVLTFANQGRNHYDTMTEAQLALEMYAPSLDQKTGVNVETLAVVAIDCYDNGDAKGIYQNMPIREV